MNNQLKVLLNRKDRIVTAAEKIVLKKIQRYCKHYKRTVKTVWGIAVIKSGELNAVSDVDEVFDTPPEKWIIEFEDKFGPFGFYVCEKGKWIEGQTRMIKFFKPKL